MTTEKTSPVTYVNPKNRTIVERIPSVFSLEAIKDPGTPNSKPVKIGFGHLDLSKVKPIEDESDNIQETKKEVHWSDCFKCGGKP